MGVTWWRMLGNGDGASPPGAAVFFGRRESPAGGIASRGNGDLPDSQLNRHGEGGGKATSLEGPGGVQPLVLDPELLGAQPAAKLLRAYERRETLAQRHDGLRVGNGQHRRVAPHIRAGAGEPIAVPVFPDGPEIVANIKRSSARAEVMDLPSLVTLATQAAFKVRNLCHRNLLAAASRSIRPGPRQSTCAKTKGAGHGYPWHIPPSAPRCGVQARRACYGVRPAARNPPPLPETARSPPARVCPRRFGEDPATCARRRPSSPRSGN